MRPLKVLHVVGAMNRAGTETMLMHLYREMNRDNVQFDFISYSDADADYDQEITSLGGRIFKLSKTTSVKAIYDVIKKYGPYAAVHAHTLFHCGIATLAAKLAGVKIRIAHAHTTADYSDSIARKIYMKTMCFVIYTTSTHLLACSKAAGNYLFGGSAIQSDKYSYFPNTIDYRLFLQQPTIAVKKFKMEVGFSNHMVIGHIGRFSEGKNQLFLIEIMKAVMKHDPEARLLLVGDGELRTFIEKKVKSEGMQDNVCFVGIRDDINTLLHSMDVFVFPSIYEGLGLVLLEAQASGIPCVVSEAIQPEADVGLGLITNLSLHDAPAVWAKQIIALQGKRMQNNNRTIEAFDSNGYTQSKAINHLISIYQSHEGEVVYEKNHDRFI